MKSPWLIHNILLAGLILAGCASHQSSPNHAGAAHSEHGMSNNDVTDRQKEVAELGKTVMPFDLNATTHIFEKIDNGGQQQVLVDDPTDVENLDLIRSHLAEEAKRFTQGDFHDPQLIHGETMPGIHELVMGIKQIAIEYQEVPNGGQILYTTDDAELVQAIHAWFDAQLSDHGQHAQGHQ